MALEDRLNTEDKEREGLIVEMLREAKGVELPSELAKSPIIHKGDETLPAPMVVSELRSGKYFWLWETETGERVPCLGYMVAQKLRQRLPDGRYRFTTTDPGITPKRGTIKCRLHKDDEDRTHFDDLGFRMCKKSNITNRYQLEQHMKKRHPQEWAAIEEERKSKERDEDRALQRLLLAQQLNKLEQENREIVVKQETKQVEFVCPTCKADFGSQKTLDKHVLKEHINK